MTNLEQARAIFNPVPRKIRGCDGSRCSGLACHEVHHLGTINQPTFTGEDYLWGTKAAGSLMGVWDIHNEKYVRVYAHFPGPPGLGGVSEDYTEAIL